MILGSIVMLLLRNLSCLEFNLFIICSFITIFENIRFENYLRFI